MAKDKQAYIDVARDTYLRHLERSNAELQSLGIPTFKVPQTLSKQSALRRIAEAMLGLHSPETVHDLSEDLRELEERANFYEQIIAETLPAAAAHWKHTGPELSKRMRELAMRRSPGRAMARRLKQTVAQDLSQMAANQGIPERSRIQWIRTKMVEARYRVSERYVRKLLEPLRARRSNT